MIVIVDKPANTADSLKADGVGPVIIQSLEAVLEQRAKLKEEEVDLDNRIKCVMVAISNLLGMAHIDSFSGPFGLVSYVKAGYSNTFDKKKLASKLMLEGINAVRVSELIKECTTSKLKSAYTMFRGAKEEG